MDKYEKAVNQFVDSFVARLRELPDSLGPLTPEDREFDALDAELDRFFESPGMSRALSRMIRSARPPRAKDLSWVLEPA